MLTWCEVDAKSWLMWRLANVTESSEYFEYEDNLKYEDDLKYNEDLK